METSVVEQLRLQEGRLFQNEGVLALFLDVKAVIYEAINSSKRGYDSDYPALEKLLFSLSPRGITNYHENSLHECVKIVAKLLWPTQILLVGKPMVCTLLEGIMKRLEASKIIECYQSLDPIKQDYIVRDAFRRSLINDCLFIFQDDDVQVQQPKGARSAIGEESVVSDVYEKHESSPKRDAKLSDQKDLETREPAKDLARPDDDDRYSVKSKVTHATIRTTKSAMPKVNTVRKELVPQNDDESVVSSVSGAGTSVSRSIQRQPLNVRIIPVAEE